MKHVARKRFGQNFLVDPSIVRAIVMALAPRPGDIVVEIGPGLGALTDPLLAALGAERLHVIELDRDLAARLKRHPLARATAAMDLSGPRLVVHEADALAFDYAALLPPRSLESPGTPGTPGPRLRIVGNLPYNISSPLLFHLKEAIAAVADQHFMLQREVVDRMVASSGTPSYGRLSVMLQVSYAMELLIEVPPEAFEPPPKVHSAVVRMVPLGAGGPRIADAAGFSTLVRQAFSQRRKMLRNTLADFDRIRPMREYGLEPRARAEDIAPEQYVAYANALAEVGGTGPLR